MIFSLVCIKLSKFNINTDMIHLSADTAGSMHISTKIQGYPAYAERFCQIMTKTAYLYNDFEIKQAY